MKDAVETMGNILPDDAGGRDAVHVAVFSAKASEDVVPGQGVCIYTESTPDYWVGPAREHEPVGIVDPFLENYVNSGERFWVYIMPRTITALSHKWSHPSFEDTATTYTPPSDKLKSEEWLREFVANSDCPGYEEVMKKAEVVAYSVPGARDEDGEPVNWNEDYIHFDGDDAHGNIPNVFWDHVEVVLGRQIRGTRASHFSCSC